MDRTLNDILESAKGGVKPSFEECYWSMLALDALAGLDMSDMLDMAAENPEVEDAVNESLRRRQQAKAIAPQAYIGWENDPANPDYQRQRKAMQSIYDHFAR